MQSYSAYFKVETDTLRTHLVQAMLIDKGVGDHGPVIERRNNKLRQIGCPDVIKPIVVNLLAPAARIFAWGYAQLSR